jgi:hypothetical protein
VAKALEKDADQGDLKKYVDGKLNLNDVGAKDKGAGDDADNVAKTCATSAASSDSASGIPAAPSSPASSG